MLEGCKGRMHQKASRDIYIYIMICIYIYQDFTQKHPRMSECQALCDVAHAQSHAVREAWMLWISGLFFSWEQASGIWMSGRLLLCIWKQVVFEDIV
jgi:hypothetical protein